MLCHTIVRLIYHKSSLRITLLCLSLVIAKWGEQWDRKFITHDFINRSFLIDQRNFILETFIVRGVLIDQRNFILEVFIVRGVLIGRRNFIWKNNFVRSEGRRCCTWLEREARRLQEKSWRESASHETGESDPSEQLPLEP